LTSSWARVAKESAMQGLRGGQEGAAG